MPLTAEGNKVLSSMTKQYGAKTGKAVFYASINKGRPGSKGWHGGKSKHGKNAYTDALKGKQMDAQEKIHNRILKKKWESLEARGYTRPKTKEENEKRAKEAHG